MALVGALALNAAMATETEETTPLNTTGGHTITDRACQDMAEGGEGLCACSECGETGASRRYFALVWKMET